MGESLRVGMVAGEASGDQLGAHLIAALRGRRSQMLFTGIGAPSMQAQGFESHFPLEKLSVPGYAGAPRPYRALMGIRRRRAKALLSARPALFSRLDSSDLPVA